MCKCGAGVVLILNVVLSSVNNTHGFEDIFTLGACAGDRALLFWCQVGWLEKEIDPL
jgi:hypothetical protein